MHSIKISIIVIANLFLMSCTKQHMRTENICNKNLYIELYEEYTGMGNIYLTDSVNFRLNVDRFNLESEYHSYECNKDSLIVRKITKDKINGKNQILEIKNFSIEKLKKEGRFDK